MVNELHDLMERYEKGIDREKMNFLQDYLATDFEAREKLKNVIKADLHLQSRFVTFEGPDGAGKTTVLNTIMPWLKNKYSKVLRTREPGGDDISEQIRSVILDPDNEQMNRHTELLLYEAARSQLVSEIIKPAINDGNLVVCDRYIDSTTAYQGGGNHFSNDDINWLNHFATQDLMPKMTIYFDVPAEVGQKRIQEHRQDKQDRLDEKALDYHRKVVSTYQELAKKHPERIHTIDGTKPLANRIEETKALFDKYIK